MDLENPSVYRWHIQPHLVLTGGEWQVSQKHPHDTNKKNYISYGDIHLEKGILIGNLELQESKKNFRVRLKHVKAAAAFYYCTQSTKESIRFKKVFLNNRFYSQTHVEQLREFHTDRDGKGRARVEQRERWSVGRGRNCARKRTWNKWEN